MVGWWFGLENNAVKAGELFLENKEKTERAKASGPVRAGGGFLKLYKPRGPNEPVIPGGDKKNSFPGGKPPDRHTAHQRDVC